MAVLRAYYGVVLFVAFAAAPAAPGVPAAGEHALVSPATLVSSAAAVERHRRIAAAGGWPVLPGGPALRPGMTGERVVRLRARLWLSGDLGMDARRGETFDAALEAVVRRFQRRHGLIDSGIVYDSTRRALNVSAATRLAQLESALAALRALVAESAAARHVTVNVAAFELEAVADGRVALRSRVIVGTPETPTPLIQAALMSLSFLPPWNAPVSVAARDIIPVARRDPVLLVERNIDVYPTADRRGTPLDPLRTDFHQTGGLWFRQEPGPFNPLGVVRFNLPNAHDIYLHDTPDKALFRRDRRALSAGCVRVEKALELAAWLLHGRAGWDAARIERTVAAGDSRGVMLAEPVPVRFVHLTAWTTPDGITRFHDGIYDTGEAVPPPARSRP